MSTGDEDITKKQHKVKVVAYYYEFFSSSPTFSDTDLAQAIYLASRGSPMLFLALSVKSVNRFTAYAHRTHVHTHAHLMFDHVSPRNMALIDMLGAVAGSAQSAITLDDLITNDNDSWNES